jgi:hypothetical protein
MANLNIADITLYKISKNIMLCQSNKRERGRECGHFHVYISNENCHMMSVSKGLPIFRYLI